MKITVSDVISIRGQVMMYMYVPTGIKMELIGKLKITVSDVISIRGQVMMYMYVPTGI